ncbi:MAG: hypothetical protein AAF221_02050 [Pseudomonadota bacterium]
MTYQYDILKELTPQRHVSILCAGLAKPDSEALQTAARAISGTVVVKSENQSEIPAALFMALRTAPQVLAITGSSGLMSDTLGGLLALQEEGIKLPAIALLDIAGNVAAAKALGMIGSVSQQLTNLRLQIERSEVPDATTAVPLLRLAQGPQLIRLGLIFATGNYAQGLGVGFEKLFQSSALMKLHMFAAKPEVNGQDDLARIAPDKGGSLSTYLSGMLLSALPLPLLSRTKTRPEKPIRYLATERSRKARMAALRAFGGQLDRAQPFYGVHLGNAGGLSMRLPGPHRMDMTELSLDASFSITPTQPLPLIDLAVAS